MAWHSELPAGKSIEKASISPALLEEIRAVNKNEDFKTLREKWPLSFNPLASLIEQKGQNIPTICILPDNSIVARVGDPYENGIVVRITDTSALLT